MKKIIILLASVAFTLSAQAEGEKKAKSGGKVNTKSKYLQDISTGSGNKTKVSVAAGSSTKLKLDKESKISASFYTIQSIKGADLNNGSYAFGNSETALSLNFKLNENESLMARQYLAFDSKVIGESIDTMGDTAFQYKHSKLIKIGKKDIATTFRGYIPTSKGSSATGKYQARAYFTVKGDLVKGWTYKNYFSPRLYGYTKNPQAQTGMLNVSVLSASKQVTEKFSMGPSLILINGYKNAGSKEVEKDGKKVQEDPANNNDELDIAFDLGYDISDKISLGFTIEQDIDLRSGNAFSFLNENEMVYSASLSVSL